MNKILFKFFIVALSSAAIQGASAMHIDDEGGFSNHSRVGEMSNDFGDDIFPSSFKIRGASPMFIEDERIKDEGELSFNSREWDLSKNFGDEAFTSSSNSRGASPMFIDDEKMVIEHKKELSFNSCEWDLSENFGDDLSAFSMQTTVGNPLISGISSEDDTHCFSPTNQLTYSMGPEDDTSLPSPITQKTYAMLDSYFSSPIRQRSSANTKGEHIEPLLTSVAKPTAYKEQKELSLSDFLGISIKNNEGQKENIFTKSSSSSRNLDAEFQGVANDPFESYFPDNFGQNKNCFALKNENKIKTNRKIHNTRSRAKNKQS